MSDVLTRPVTPPQAPALGAPELTVVVPVLNERDNILPLVEKLRAVLAGVAWEVIFVDDDSRDGTRVAVAEIGRTDPRVRLLHRIGRRGLSSAFIEGAQASISPYIAAIDGDLQHDETVLPKMLAAIRDDGIDVAIGSRYVAGGGVGAWDSKRAGMSSFATRLSQLVLRVPIADPMSGFFMLRRETFDRSVRHLSAMGFKILLDIVASLPEPPKVRELPFTFRNRVAGESKLDAGVLRDYLLLIIDKLVGHVVPVRFILFAGVGALGVAANLVVLRIGLKFDGLDFATAQALATGCAIVGNFWLNNIFTFREGRLKGARMITGLLTFSLISSVGAVANVNVSSLLYGSAHSSWWFAGIAGAIMSLVWNYAVSSVFTWRRA
jgi:dolichol-phosphate mannosyltransferase